MRLSGIIVYRYVVKHRRQAILNILVILSIP